MGYTEEMASSLSLKMNPEDEMNNANPENEESLQDKAKKASSSSCRRKPHDAIVQLAISD